MIWPWKRQTFVWSPWMSPAEIDAVNGLEPPLEGPAEVPPPARVYWADGEPIEMMDPGEGLLW